MQSKKTVWKVFASIIMSYLIIVSWVSAGSTKPVRVFLLGGQSNMVGMGQVAALKPPYNENFQKIKVWDSKKLTWITLDPAELLKSVNSKGSFGPEISFGHAVAEAFPGEDIRLVKYAASGTALYNDWSPSTTGKQYTVFMKTAKAALAELDSANVKYEIAGMLWLQGESDAQENQAETYEKNLTEFIAHMRTEFKTPGMPFIIARVRNHYGGKTGQAKIVRDAQVKVADDDENAGWFDTDDCSMLNPGHYDTEGLIEIGKRFGETFQKVVGGAKK